MGSMSIGQLVLLYPCCSSGRLHWGYDDGAIIYYYWITL